MIKNHYYESISFSEGKSFNVSNFIESTYVNKLHWHPFVEILVSLQSKNEVEINYTKYILGMNDIVIIYPGDLHSVQKCDENSWLVIQFPYNLLTVVSELKSQLSMLSKYPLCKYIPQAAHSDRLILLMKEFWECNNSVNPFKEVHMYSLILQFFESIAQDCLYKDLDPGHDFSSAGTEKTKKIAEACLYISANCTQSLTLDNVASYMGISKSHFAHLFKQYTNKTFVDFLTEERVKRAQSLFFDSKMSITDIAFESGFSSISSFNRSFKKIAGISPSKYRETMSN